MKEEQLFEGNKIRNQILRLTHILTRLECGDGFFNIQFIGHQNKTMDAIEETIADKDVVKCYKDFIYNRIAQLKKEFEIL